MKETREDKKTRKNAKGSKISKLKKNIPKCSKNKSKIDNLK